MERYGRVTPQATYDVFEKTCSEIIKKFPKPLVRVKASTALNLFYVR